MWDTLDGGANQSSVQGLLKVHLLHRLHGLPLSELRLDLRDILDGVLTELFIRGFLLLGLGVNSCNTKSLQAAGYAAPHCSPCSAPWSEG